jgi:hypothetical protein
LVDRAPRLGLWCAEETSSAQWTISVPSLHLLTPRREEARKGRYACEGHTHPRALLLPQRHRASLGGAGPVMLRFLPSTLLLNMKQEATDGFVREPRGCCHCPERFVLLHDTLHHGRPMGSGKTVRQACWPWPPFASHRRRTGVSGFVLSQQVLDLERQFSRRGKEERKNW